MENDSLVNVPVPRRHLSAVYGFIAQLDAAGGPATAADAAAQPAHGSGKDEDRLAEWTPSRLRRAIEESSPNLLKVFAALADRPGDWLSTGDLAAAIGPNADWKTVAGGLGAFGRRVTSRYGLKTFPFENRFDHATNGRVCRMDAEMAKQVKKYIAER